MSSSFSLVSIGFSFVHFPLLSCHPISLPLHPCCPPLISPEQVFGLSAEAGSKGWQLPLIPAECPMFCLPAPSWDHATKHERPTKIPGGFNSLLEDSYHWMVKKRQQVNKKEWQRMIEQGTYKIERRETKKERGPRLVAYCCWAGLWLISY